MAGGRHLYQMDLIDEANVGMRTAAGVQEDNTANYASTGREFGAGGVDALLAGSVEEVTSTINNKGLLIAEGTHGQNRGGTEILNTAQTGQQTIRGQLMRGL